MKSHLILITVHLYFSFSCSAQYSKGTFLDSLKNTVFLKDYFQKNDEYNDSCYAEYLNSIFKIDSFEIDSNCGFGFNPTSIAVTYEDPPNLKFYCGLSVIKWDNKNLKELCFYDYYGQKTALSWTFYKNGKIETINYYKPVSQDKLRSKTFLSKQSTYSIKKFRKSGKLELTGEIINEKKNGEWFYYNKKGILFKKEKFNNNNRISKVGF
tara:strand:+ start:189 stop:818 length:630 start_codon:yes stop_codon:yes gene_type:complete